MIQPSFSEVSAEPGRGEGGIEAEQRGLCEGKTPWLTWVICDLSVLCRGWRVSLQRLDSSLALDRNEENRCRQRNSLDQTTLPPVVTIPNSLTLTSMIVPFVKTPREVYSGDWGFFLTPIMGSWKVVFNSADRSVRCDQRTSYGCQLTMCDVGLVHTLLVSFPLTIL